MSKSKQMKKSPSIGSHEISQSVTQHWSDAVQVVNLMLNGGPSAINLLGGAENGQFCWIGGVLKDQVSYQDGIQLDTGDIVLEVGGQCIAGYTMCDAIDWIESVSSKGQLMMKTVVPGILTRDLREFLNMRFQKGSVDHELQQIIRTNIYKRTVPCTTRPPRPGEVNGVDYQFLTVDQFRELERNGELLESGIFDDNHYGTPKPPKEPVIAQDNGVSNEPSSFRRAGSVGSLSSTGQRSASNGNHQRNHSNIEAHSSSMQPAAAVLQQNKSSEHLNGAPDQHPTESWLTQVSRPDSRFPEGQTDSGRLLYKQDRGVVEELPPGWEKVDDPQFGIYYIDHINKRTQYEKPVFKDQAPLEVRPSSALGNQPSKQRNAGKSTGYNGVEQNSFTRNPDELKGTFVSTTLIKSIRGLGFTIVGGEDDEVGHEEFLQIKSINAGGPAALDGKLQPSDVLVSVNEHVVLGYSHQDVIALFKSIPVGETVTIEVCRGYPLPFDPDDPTNEIITTVAVAEPSIPGAGYRTSSPVPSMHSIDIKKGSQGFGFTIADTVHGQCVKNILDRPRCKGLSEGDLLVAVNQTDVRDMKHLGVVDVLKTCPVGSTATFVIQRGGLEPSEQLKKVPSSNLIDEAGLPKRSPQLGVDSYQHHSPGSSAEAEVSMLNRAGLQSVSSDRGPKPEVLPKPGFMERLPLDSSASFVSDSQIPGANDRQLNAMPGFNVQSDVMSSQQQVWTDVVDVPLRRPVQRGVSLRDDLFRQPVAENRQPTDSVTGYSAADYLRNESLPALQRNFSNQLSFNEFDRSGRNRPGPSRLRSKTPGPDFLRGSVRSNGYDDQELNFLSSQVAVNELRSKTPTSDMYRSQPIPKTRRPISGTPDFIPASQYVSNTQMGPPDVIALKEPSSLGWPPGPQSQGILFNGPNGIGNPQSFNDPLAQLPRYLGNPGIDQISGLRVPPTTFTSRLPSSNVLSSRNSVDEQFYDMPIYLQRSESGFGFRIVGGTEEGSQVSVGHIVPGGAADLDGLLRPGDEITFVNGIDVIGSSHHKVVQLMTDAATTGHVTLRIRRRASRFSELSGVSVQPVRFNYPYDVTLNRRDYESFGFILVSSTSRAGSVIGSITKGSPADRSEALHIGDHVIAVNGVNVSQSHHELIVSKIKESGCSVMLTIGPPDNASSTPASVAKRYPPSVLSSSTGLIGFTSQSDSEMSQRSEYSPYRSTTYMQTHSPATSNSLSERSPNDSVYRRPFASQPTSRTSDVDLPAAAGGGGGDNDRLLIVELQRGTRGFGFSIRGGREFNNMPLYVLKIADGGAASTDGRLRVGDQILEINGHPTASMTHSEAIEQIQSGKSHVRLLVKRTAIIRASNPLSYMSPTGQPQIPVAYSNNGMEVLTDPNANGSRQHGPSSFMPAVSSSYGQLQPTGKYSMVYR